MVADNVTGGHVGEHGHGDAPLAVLLGRDDGGGRGPAFADHVDLQLDGTGADHDRPREHCVHRAHRLVREPFGHSDNRLGQHLGSFDHLPFVLTSESGLGDELVLPGGLHVEEVQQPLDRPLRLS